MTMMENAWCCDAGKYGGMDLNILGWSTQSTRLDVDSVTNSWLSAFLRVYNNCGWHKERAIVFDKCICSCYKASVMWV